MIQEKGKRRARRAPALLAAYLALALLAGCTGGAGSSAAEQNSASSSGAAESALPAPAAPQETVFSGASSSCLPSEPPEDAPETLGPGHFTSVQDRAEGEQDPYLELYADGTFMFMCNVYQGMTTYLGTWSYERRSDADAPQRGGDLCFLRAGRRHAADAQRRPGDDAARRSAHTAGAVA